jgi:hypothetical protein
MPGRVNSKNGYTLSSSGLSESQYNNVKKLMYYGVPNDQTGLFEEETPVTADVTKNARVLGARRTPKTGENRSMTTLLSAAVFITAVYGFLKPEKNKI